MGLATAAWMEPYWGGAYYHPATGAAIRCCASASANVYGHWGATTYSGTRSLVRGRRRRRHDRERQLLQQPHRHVGHLQRRPAVQRVDRQRDARLRPHDERRGRRLRQRRARAATTTSTPGSARPAIARVGHRRGRQHLQPRRRDDRGPEGDAHVGGGSTYNAKTGKTNTWGTASVGNNHYADVNGNVYKNTGDGWQQHSSSGWSSASGDTSWADKESQARSAGDDRAGSFSEASPMSRSDGGFGGGDRFGGGGFGGFGGGDRFGGGGGWGGRFGGGGFGGGGFRGGGRR